MNNQHQPVAMSETGRTEAFSDGVLAIAVTLLVLDLHVSPRTALHEPLAVALAHEWPAYAAYVTSFLIIGIIWVNHHAVFELVGRVDRSVLFLNLLLLMSVVAIPFGTALLSEYLLAGNGDARSAALVYSAIMLAMSFGLAVARPSTADAIGAVRSTLTVSTDTGSMRAKWERCDDGATWQPWMDMTFTGCRQPRLSNYAVQPPSWSSRLWPWHYLVG